MGLAASSLGLAAFQALAVVLPGPPPRLPSALRRRSVALVPPLAIVLVVGSLVVFPAVAGALATAAALGVPALAVTGPVLARGRRRILLLALAAVALPVALAASGPVVEAARVLLIVLACVPLGQLVVAAAPAPLVELGIAAMTAADVVLVVAQQVQPASRTLHQAAPPGGLPALQDATLGSVTLGFGDLFLAAVLGGVLACRPAERRRAALVTGVTAALFGLLLAVVDTVPATVPVLAGLLASRATRRDLATRARPRS